MAMDFARNRLEQGDQVQKTYMTRLEGKYGHLVLSNRKLLFIEEKGLVRKTYSLVWETPYDKIEDIRSVDNHTLELTEAGGQKRVFKSDIAVSNIEESIRQLMTSNLPQAKA